MTERFIVPEENGGNGFLEDACVVYGEEAAMVISDSIISGLGYAQAMLSLDNIDTLRLHLAVMRPPGKHDRDHPVHAWANGSENSIAFMINPDATTAEIAESLYRAVPHELGHIAHYRCNPKFGNESAEAKPYNHFSSAIQEGIARSAEVLENPDANILARGFYKYRLGIKEGVRLLLDPEATADFESYDVLYGNIKELDDVYAIGHYVVSSLALAEKRDFQALLRTPLMEYVEIAQAELT